MEGVGVVEGFEARQARLRELEHQQLPARLERPAHRAERRGLVGDVAQAEADGDAVEGAVAKRQPLGVGLHTGDIAGEARIEQAVASAGQHRRVDVAQDHEPARADLPRQSRRQIARAACNIEGALPGPQIGKREREALPQPVRAGGHQVVHQVVIVGDRVEHAAHAARFVFARHALEAEVGGALVAHLRSAGVMRHILVDRHACS